MAQQSKVLVVIGTRPEAIKMAPVIRALNRDESRFKVITCITGQHRELVDLALDLFGIARDIDLAVMQPGQTLNYLAACMFDLIDQHLVCEQPDWVLVQGDTTTAMVTATAAFHRGVRVAHVEAGLRTGDLFQPFPEEFNRRTIDLVSRLHFAPTAQAAWQLRSELPDSKGIHVTGNTIVDAIELLKGQLPTEEPERRMVLITTHRRESFGEPMRAALRAIRRLAKNFPQVQFLFPVHPNPAVQDVSEEVLGTCLNVQRVAPAGYLQLLGWLQDSIFVITDSGGIQEEAPAFSTPALVLRNSTERPEGVAAGLAVLVGTDEDRIYNEAQRLLLEPERRKLMVSATNPYGDGRAAGRIVRLLAGEETDSFQPEFLSTRAMD